MSEATLTVRVPLAVRKRGGRKVVLAPDQAAMVVRVKGPANWTLVKNLARAFRWQRMLESGEYATIAELAKAEGVTDSYLSRMLKLPLLPPNEVDTIISALTNPERPIAVRTAMPHVEAVLEGTLNRVAPFQPLQLAPVES